jgi:hypothetical protein
MWTLLAAALLANPIAPIEGGEPLAIQNAERVLLNEPIPRVTDPSEARAAMLRAQKDWTRQLYAGLFEEFEFELEPDRIDDLTTLIAEHILLTTGSLGSTYVSAGEQGAVHFTPTDEDRARANEYLSKIESLLGPRGYALFEGYRATLPERAYLRGIVQALAVSGVPVEPEEMTQLVEVVKSERERMQATPISAPSNTVAGAEAIIERLDDLDVRIEQRVEALLSSEQQEIAARLFVERKRKRHVALDQHRQYVVEGGSPEAFTYPPH